MPKQNKRPFFFFIMRLNLKAVLFSLIASVIIITCAFYMLHDMNFTDNHNWDRPLYQVEEIGSSRNIDCLINQEYSIHCLHDLQSNEVYLPFSFLRNYFDVSGSLSSGQGTPKFIWMHSNSKINQPKGKYNPTGIFMYFENYNVEIRDRVKCIAAAGVPVSTQWAKTGYFYPTQIAQFGLSHYSKNYTESSPKVRVLENCDESKSNWTLPKDSNMSRIWHPKFDSYVIRYETPEKSAISLQVNQFSELVLTLDFLLVTNCSRVIVTVKQLETNKIFRVHYMPADLLISVQEENIYYGLGVAALNKWRRMTRDLHIDIIKGIAAVNNNGDRKSQHNSTKIKRTDLQIVSIAFQGVGFFDNITISTSAHGKQFYDAAEWLIANQNLSTGGWPNPVKRNLNGFQELKSGWISSMGQGHAISVLARAFWHSGEKKYLKAAALGLKPFRVLSKDGGIVAKFLDKYNWYEEYPTTPPSFVLNGFIYSLLGLYDLNYTGPSHVAAEASKLFNQGMNSLKRMLLLYDTGSGTSYDLRHLSLGVAPNLARWDYHATHVNQLLLLATIDGDPIFSKTAERWKGYMFGRRAKHN